MLINLSEVFTLEGKEKTWDCLLYTSQIFHTEIFQEIQWRLRDEEKRRRKDYDDLRRSITQYLEAVSYTHLDVYKRQSLTSGTSRSFIV